MKIKENAKEKVKETTTEKGSRVMFVDQECQHIDQHKGQHKDQHIDLGGQLSPQHAGKNIAVLTEAQRNDFQGNGFLVVEDALDRDELLMYRSLLADCDQTITQNYGGFESDGSRQAGDHLELRNAVAQSPKILDLMVHPKTFPLIVELMGPHLCLTTSHILLRPSSPKGTGDEHKQVGWHRDGPAFPTCNSEGALPWLYTKVGYFLTDTTIPDCGALRAIPGSHRYSGAAAQDSDHWEPYGAVELGVKAGSAIIFDNRVFHSVGPNYSAVTRENIYLGYCWRHIRSIDFVEQDPSMMEGCTPIQKQLLGASTDACGYFLPQKSDVPLEGFHRDITRSNDS